MKFVYQTSINGTRQKEQAIVKQAAQKAGIDLELKSVTASVFFSSDVANPDTYGKFWADMQMYTTTMTAPDAERFMDQYTSAEISQKANKWRAATSAATSTPNTTSSSRRREPELDPVKRAAIYIKMNDMVVNDHVIIPLISRPRVRGGNLKLVTTLSGWDLDFSALQNWYRDRRRLTARGGGRLRRDADASPSGHRDRDERRTSCARWSRMCAPAACRGARSSPAWPGCGVSRAARLGDARCVGIAPAQTAPTVQADQARRRRDAAAAVLAGADAAEPALRDRREGPGRLAPVLRAAGALRRRRQPRGGARGRDPQPRQRRHRRRRPLDDAGSSRRASRWHDGKPFTADDVVFNWDLRHRPGDGGDRPSRSLRKTSRVEEDRRRHRPLRVPQAVAALVHRSVAAEGLLVPKHLFEAYAGARSREAPANLKPVGTGPYTLRRLHAGRPAARRDQPRLPPGRIGRTSTAIEIKGGGDATSAARAVLQTGEYDYAWNLQVEDDVLKRMEASGKGRCRRVPERQHRDDLAQPRRPVDRGRRRALEPRESRHPVLPDPAVREALALLLDRQSIQEFVYGRAGVATAELHQQPGALQQRRTSKAEFSIDQANAAARRGRLEAAAPTACARRTARSSSCCSRPRSTRCARRCRPSSSRPAQKAGIEVELKTVTAAVFFSSDVGNPDTYSKFLRRPGDVRRPPRPRPTPTASCSVRRRGRPRSKANKWQGLNIAGAGPTTNTTAVPRRRGELDPVKRAALFIAMNDLVVQRARRSSRSSIRPRDARRCARQLVGAAHRLGHWRSAALAELVPREA